MIDARLRYENVDTPSVDADAVTSAGSAAGFEAEALERPFSFLAEG